MSYKEALAQNAGAIWASRLYGLILSSSRPHNEVEKEVPSV